MSNTLRSFGEICRQVPMMEHLSYRQYLGALFATLKARLGHYSYEAFAVDLGFSATNVIRLVIAGKRRLTPMATERIIKSIDLRGDDRRYFLALVRYTNARKPEQREKFFKELVALRGHSLNDVTQQAALSYYSEWYHPVIRELCGTSSFKSDPQWIAARLYNGLLPRHAAKSLELLEQLNLITFDKALDRHVQSGGQWTPDRPVETMAAVRWHQKVIEIGRESVTRIDESLREIHGLTLRVSPETVGRIKELLLAVCEEAMKLEAADPQAEDVYQLNVQFFPFTKAR